MKFQVFCIAVSFAAAAAHAQVCSDVYCFGNGSHTFPTVGSFTVSGIPTSTLSLEGSSLGGPLAGDGWRFGDQTPGTIGNTHGSTSMAVSIVFDQPVPASKVAAIVSDVESTGVTITTARPSGGVNLDLFQTPGGSSTCVVSLSGNTFVVGGCTNEDGTDALATGRNDQLVTSIMLRSGPGNAGDWIGLGFGIVMPCPIDADFNGLLDLADVLAFAQRFEAGAWQADLTGGEPGRVGDGLFDLADVGRFVELFLGGCE